MTSLIPQDHPHRSAVMEEVHARPVQIVPDACRVRRLVLVMPGEPGAMQNAFDRFATFRRAAGMELPQSASRQYSFATPKRDVTWEFHTEFITITWRSAIDDGENWPEDIGLEAVGDGTLIGAMRIDVITDTTIPERLLPGFNLASLCLSDIEGGKAQVITDFVPDAARFTRIEFAAGGLTTLRRSILLRRLLEVETYRSMALLGLPLARSASADLRGMETELSRVIDGLSDATSPASAQTVLDALHGLSVRSGQLSERLGYRFAAGRAYGEVLRTRLMGLREQGTSRGSTLTHYIGNRVDPGLATCAAIEQRLSVLSAKIERAIGLLNVRIGVDMQVQNAALLDNIARTARSQFLLQRTVEGLSTIAISYYLLGIISYLLAGPLTQLHWDKTMALSLAAPFVVLAVWLMARAVRRAHEPH
ncbi:DUF3422 domain-containing protein [Devosia sp. 63-57]|uniref:DUF3422 domain-containing protein n=1 Tax=Devosia sp. 63-57 TaxID=1895751 RepID=UPI00086DB2CD|nr:DUF3422 domain-containing protein [Devosia sp. 63-57]ODU87109.1 MAG: hypothetical protein ABT14_06655 [Pelagibacterium sp. SCN 63-17]OJX42859.1 MAG: hypothetical protein BGO80_15630 [Devosia sp. 63-57]